MCHVQRASCDMQCVTFIVPIASSGGPSKRPCLMGGHSSASWEAQLSLMGGTAQPHGRHSSVSWEARSLDHAKGQRQRQRRAACTVVTSVQLVWLDALGGSAALTEALLDALHDALRAKLAALWVTPAAAAPCGPTPRYTCA
jgi:hypothetical protein